MRKSAPPMPRVAIAYPGSVPWIARCLDGIRSYAQREGGWRLYTSPPTLGSTGEWEISLRALRDWEGQGIIAVSGDVEELRLAGDIGIPIVNLGAALPENHGVPRVMVDHVHAGCMAAEHLLERGLSRLAFFGWTNLWYSEKRQEGFVKRAAESKIECEVLLEVPSAEPHQTWRERMLGPVEWLTSLPRPCGVFAVQDYRARLLVEACEHAGLRVPEDIAIIGMDNNETVCQHSVPTLTSVSRNSEKVGWEAAALLHRMMQGRKVPTTDKFVAPDGVIARQSTDVLYYADPVVRRAVGFLHENLARGFNVTEIAEHAGVSKRTLEMRFRQSTDTSPHEYLLKARVKRAETLMREPGKTLQRIATECGFHTYPTFVAAIRRCKGVTPNALREINLPRLG